MEPGWRRLISVDKVKIWLEGVREADFSYLYSSEYLALAAIALALCLLFLAIRQIPPRLIPAFRGETGQVRISRQALLEIVLAACEQLPEVRRPSIRLRSRKKVDIEVRIRLDGPAMLRDTASCLQSHLKESLTNNLGIERLGNISILVTGIRRGGQAHQRLPEAPPESPAPEDSAEKEKA